MLISLCCAATATPVSRAGSWAVSPRSWHEKPPCPYWCCARMDPCLGGARAHPGAIRPLRALVPLDGSAHTKTALEPAAYLLAVLAKKIEETHENDRDCF